MRTSGFLGATLPAGLVESGCDGRTVLPVQGAKREYSSRDLVEGRLVTSSRRRGSLALSELDLRKRVHEHFRPAQMLRNLPVHNDGLLHERLQ